MDRGVLAAIRLLPSYRKSIEELALLSDSFRTLCGDIAEAELALERWENSTLPGKEARCAEYRSIINGSRPNSARPSTSGSSSPGCEGHETERLF